jgi:hypothetical protein
MIDLKESLFKLLVQGLIARVVQYHQVVNVEEEYEIVVGEQTRVSGDWA